MKTNAKVVIWMCVAVPFVVAVTIAVSSPGGVVAQAKSDLGPVAWSEIAKINGGGEGGCSTKRENCEGEYDDSLSCAQKKFTGNTITLWQGGTFQAPYTLSNPTSTLAPIEDSTPDCYIDYDCNPGRYSEYMHCSDSGCVSGEDEFGCTSITCSNPRPSKVSSGRCIDP